MNEITIREKNAIMKSYAAGLVPRLGLQHLVVGRKREIEALCHDLDLIKEGGAAFRLVTGAYGSGKSFFEHLVKLIAIKDDLVVIHADLSVNCRLHGTDGKGRTLYAELMTNFTTKAYPEGNGLRGFLEGWISNVHHEITSQGGSVEEVGQEIQKRLRGLKDYVGGNEFAAVLALYYQGYASDKPDQQDAAIRWLKAEYSTKTDARKDLGVRRIIGDEDLYNSFKLFAAFCRIAGYKGLLIILDELSTMTHRLPNSKSRQGSFEVLLTMINGCFQGNVQGLGFLLAGTPECLTDPDRGFFSYPPLRSRLQTYDQRGTASSSGSVLRLEPLRPAELILLLQNLRRVHALGDESKYLIPDEALKSFLDKTYAKLGAKCLKNPREVVRPFVSLLESLQQNPGEGLEESINRIIDSIPKHSNEVEKEFEDFHIK